MNELDVETLEKSYAALASRGEEIVERFYLELFSRFPQVKPLFARTNQKEQQKKLLTALSLVVNNLRKPMALDKTLREMGARHQGYGAVSGHYQAVASTLLDVMKDVAGPLWTPQVAQAWTDALDAVAKKMLDGYKTEDRDMAVNGNATEGNAEIVELKKMQTAVDNAMTPIMMINRDLVITYTNKSTVALLKKHEAVLRTLYPAFNVEKLLGTCIDIFHKNPAHQRTMLADPSRLPYSTDIHVGPLVFRINVTALRDETGTYIGNALEWSDVTQMRIKDDEVARVRGAVDGAMTCIMMIDRDFVVTYANKATVELLSKHQQTLRSLFPGFDAKKILGSNIDQFHKNPAHQRKMLSDPNNLPYTTDIQVGPLKFSLNVTAIRDAAGNYVGNSLEWSDVTLLRQRELEVARLQSAVDGATANLMLCDADLNITYVNPAVVNMMARREHDLRKMFSGFEARNLVGKNIDMFHKNPAHQRALLKDKNRLPARAEISVGGLEFEVNATMVLDAKGNYMGNMVEWKDITEQKDAQRQIEMLINAAIAGNLSSRISAAEYQGFMKSLGEGVNKLMDTVVRPIQDVTRVVKALAEGKLTDRMDGDFQGEFAVMRDAINASMTNLMDTVVKIRESSGNITSGVGEIAQGNADLSQRTEEQASSLEETASSMEEMTSTVKQNADNARQANQLAADARTQAEKGGQVVGNAITAMSEINNSSKKIADIIGVIDEIAFQTNLLALNAAVEAARAGEQGRGFAVVATEVRNLAQRSAAAAKEIKALIKDSVEKVDLGSRLVNDSGKTLTDIVGAVKKVSDIIAEIAAASQEQSSGIEQVNKAIMQMDEVTQQNAALVEQAAAASESVDEQAKELMRLMEYFDVGEAEQTIAPSVKRTVSAKSAPPVKSGRPTVTKAPEKPASKPVRNAIRPNPGPRRAEAKETASTEEWVEF